MFLPLALKSYNICTFCTVFKKKKKKKKKKQQIQCLDEGFEIIFFFFSFLLSWQ